jgi:hypothetical protein
LDRIFAFACDLLHTNENSKKKNFLMSSLVGTQRQSSLTEALWYSAAESRFSAYNVKTGEDRWANTAVRFISSTCVICLGGGEISGVIPDPDPGSNRRRRRTPHSFNGSRIGVRDDTENGIDGQTERRKGHGPWIISCPGGFRRARIPATTRIATTTPDSNRTAV